MYRKYYLGLLFFLVSSVTVQSQSCLCDTHDDETYYKWYRVSVPSGLILRKGPSKNAIKLDAIPFGEEVLACSTTDIVETIEDKSGNWIKVTWADKTGYLFSGFLTETYERKVRMIIPNSGVDSGWDCMELTPEMTWKALVNADTSQNLYRKDNPTRFFSAELKIGKRSNGEDSDCPGLLNNAVLNMSDAPFAVFSGFKPSNMVYNQVSKPIKLMPGEVEGFHIYDPINRIDRMYSIAVEGNIVPNTNFIKGDLQGPIHSIEHYKINLYEQEQVPSTPNSRTNRKVQKLVDTTIKKPGDSDTNDMDVFYIYFAGDIDGDHQLDLVLARLNGVGHSYHLYLSSKKLPGFLLRYVAMWSDSAC